MSKNKNKDKHNQFENGAYDAQNIADRLELSLWVLDNQSRRHKWILTDHARTRFMEIGLRYGKEYDEVYKNLNDKYEKEAIQILRDLKGTGENGGIQQCREEVTGLGGATKNKNFSNGGFGGGCTARLAAA